MLWNAGCLCDRFESSTNKSIRDFINNNLSTEIFYRGSEKLKDTAMPLRKITGRKPGCKTGLKKGSFENCRALVKGFNILVAVYTKRQPRRIAAILSLLQGNVYWFKPESKNRTAELPVYKHPLLHENTST
jgi:hypothetical protein